MGDDGAERNYISPLAFGGSPDVLTMSWLPVRSKPCAWRTACHAVSPQIANTSPLAHHFLTTSRIGHACTGMEAETRARFHPLGANEGGNTIEGAQVLDVAPLGGTLVLFDSVAVPHEVCPIPHLHAPAPEALPEALHNLLTQSLASVSVSQVLATERGRCLAMAGWFHERSQEMPSWINE